MRPPRLLVRLLSLVTLVGLIPLAGWVPAAQASTVVHDAFSFPVDEVADDICPFPIRFSGTVSAQVEAFFDDAGNFTKVILHFSNVLALSGNGVTLQHVERFNEFDVGFDGTGAPSTVITAGLLVHDQLPDGRTVALEVGRIVEDAATGDVTFTAGHSGDPAAFCAAFG